jgi:hypothetical protein
MTAIKPDGEHLGITASSWNTVWFYGELADADTWLKASSYLGGKVKDPNNAKVFQGTANGQSAIYIFFRG